MQKPFDISEKVFSDLKQKLKNLSETQSIAEFLNLNESNTDIIELISYLKIYNKYDKSDNLNNDLKKNLGNFEDTTIAVAEQKENVDVVSNQDDESAIITLEDNLQKVEGFDDTIIAASKESNEAVVLNKEIDNEEFVENNSKKDVEQDSDFDDTLIAVAEQSDDIEIVFEDKHLPQTESYNTENLDEHTEINENLALENLKYSNLDFEGEDESNIDAEEFNKEENLANIEKDSPKKDAFISPEQIETLQQKHLEEKKFRLSNIKGVKKMETLFEDEFFEEIVPSESEKSEKSLLKSNVSIDYMEAEKAKPAFRLDLNDRIAFTKKLFGGSQTDLNDAVNRLNDFETIEEAKEYLSEIYYEKGWDKEDEFAQRLWNLVESKFQ